MMRRLVFNVVVGGLAAGRMLAAEAAVVPQIDGDFWQVTGDPDLGKYTTAKQQPVDFAVWQAPDGSWQLWSCIRSIAMSGKTRLFYRWVPFDNLCSK
jgi:hypothetical protein